MIGYFKALAAWTMKRNAALQAVRKAYAETQERSWRILSTKASREKRAHHTGEKLRAAQRDLEITEHDKPIRPDLTRGVGWEDDE